MTTTSIDICAQSLIKIGANTISSFEDGSAEARVAAALYDPTKDGLLSSHPWTFATKFADLAQTTDEPLADYDYVSQLPSDVLRIISAGYSTTSQGLEYKIIGDKLYANAEDVKMKYIARVSEEYLPAFFQNVLRLKLSAEFAPILTENLTLADFLGKQADKELKSARLIDSQQETTEHITSYPLTDVRG